MKVTVHLFASTGEAYDATQCDDEIQKGDILVIPSERVVGVAYTWPFAVTEAYGDLHTVAPDAPQDMLDEFGEFMAEAKRVAEMFGYA